MIYAQKLLISSHVHLKIPLLVEGPDQYLMLIGEI